ncbi:MAG TPA: MarR family transcriptional regulator [Gaiellaceae bacterium]|nr:MarR family transcriptional regulator [Gaiellaceae bacterium]
MSSPSRPDVREVADRLHSASIHLLRRVRRVDEESGLSAARLSALSVLVFGGPWTLGQLARAEQVSAPTMSKLVSGLERDGVAVREPHSDDGRAVLVRATPKGRRILEQGRARRTEELARLLEDLSHDELELLESAARLLEAAASRPPSA